MHRIVNLGIDKIIQAVAGSLPFEKLFAKLWVWHHEGLEASQKQRGRVNRK